MKPDLHHDGPITVELIDGLIEQMTERAGQLPLDMFVEGRLDKEWPDTRTNWLSQFDYAKGRLREVRDAVTGGKSILDHYHGTIIDICLCVVRDFDRAKALNFTNPDFKG